MNYHFAVIPTNLIEAMWDKIEPHVQRVVDASAGEITAETVKQKALEDKSSIVAVCKGDMIVAVNTLEVCTYDSGMRALLIPVVGGTEAFEWGPAFLAECNQLAKSLGCSEMRGFSSRQSWLKVLKNYGWYESHFVIKRDVE